MLRFKILFLAAFISAPAAAQQFSGFLVDATSGWSIGDRNAGISEQQRGDGFAHSIAGGYDVRIGNNAVLGILGEASDGTGRSCAQIPACARAPPQPLGRNQARLAGFDQAFS